MSMDLTDVFTLTWQTADAIVSMCKSRGAEDLILLLIAIVLISMLISVMLSTDLTEVICAIKEAVKKVRFNMAVRYYKHKYSKASQRDSLDLNRLIKVYRALYEKIKCEDLFKGDYFGACEKCLDVAKRFRSTYMELQQLTKDNKLDAYSDVITKVYDSFMVNARTGLSILLEGESGLVNKGSKALLKQCQKTCSDLTNSSVDLEHTLKQTVALMQQKSLYEVGNKIIAVEDLNNLVNDLREFNSAAQEGADPKIEMLIKKYE